VELRPLGGTGKEISAIVFGAGAVGGGVFRGERSDRLATVQRARELGISWIDTAPGYGSGESESNLGWILPELGWDPEVSTKVRLSAADLEDIPAAVRASLDASLERLGRERVTLLQLHNSIGRERRSDAGVVSIDDVLAPGGVADALARERDEGRTGLVGFTALGDVDVLHELVASGRFDTLQAYHNVLNPSATRSMPEGLASADYRELAVRASECGMGVLNIRVLAAGALAGQTARAGGPAMSPGSEPDRDLERAALVDAALEGEPGTPAQRAIRFALGRPGISGVLVGFSNAAQVEEAVAASELPAISEAGLARLERLYESDFGSR
jgi:aryl-alcohol dehydrogenase-like predicted oxidoreductase